MKKNNQLSFISLFSGAGGFKIGFEEAGFKCLLSSDVERTSKLTHLKNFKEIPFLLQDIRTIKAKQILKLTHTKLGIVADETASPNLFRFP